MMFIDKRLMEIEVSENTGVKYANYYGDIEVTNATDVAKQWVELAKVAKEMGADVFSDIFFGDKEDLWIVKKVFTKDWNPRRITIMDRVRRLSKENLALKKNTIEFVDNGVGYSFSIYLND